MRGSEMESSDWHDIKNAPLNLYGKRFGPVILIWNRATRSPVSAYFDPMAIFEDSDTGPGWVVDDGIGDSIIAPEDAAAWMPVAVPWKEIETGKKK